MTPTTFRTVVAAFAWSLAAGCATVGPDYARPPVQTPDSFRGSLPLETASSLGDQHWPTIVTDDVLRDLITIALQQNYDVKIAAARILQAEALLGITRADQFPTVNGQAVGQGQRTSVGSDDEARTVGVAQMGAAVSWAPDFWGRYRRATEADRAQLLAAQWAQRAVITTLISQVATGYYTLRALDLESSIASRTLITREESLRLTRVREQGGATSLVDVRQAEQLVFGARATIVDVRRAIEQQENFLSTLLGRGPGPIPRGQPLIEQPRPPEVPAGLPSALLARRPDIQAAEQQIVSANAEIGIARAAFFPQVTLTGSGGVASSALAALFSGPAVAWTAAAAVVQPLFDGGRNRSSLAFAEGRRDEAVLAYRQTILTSLREVSDSLVAYRFAGDLRTEQQSLVQAAQDARRLADIRYQGGVASYLEVLDSDTRLFTAELGLARAQLDELAAFIEIYRALGGGWQQ